MDMLKTQNLPATALLFHALSDPTRLELVRMLAGGERCVCELTGAMGAAQSRLSFHLKTLKSAGLVSDRKDGRWVYYSLNQEALAAIGEFGESLREASSSQSNGCCS
jgi:ArsR family transcriptional regulator